MISCPCDNCGKSFSTYPCRIKAAVKHFCSKECAKSFRIELLLVNGEGSRYKPGHVPSGKRKMPKNVDNYAWKGEGVGYRGLHYWIRRQKGAPEVCSQCGATNKRLQWANVDGRYRRDVNDFIGMCASCHKLYDLHLKSANQD